MSHVTEHLKERGIEFEVLRHEPTMTSLAEAHALGVPEDSVAKTVVLDVRTGHAFAVVPADCDLDLDKVRQAINSRHVELASEDEIERDYPEFELGAVPPLGAMVHTPLIVDEKIIDHDEIIFAAGTQDESVKVKTRDLFESANMRVADICSD